MTDEQLPIPTTFGGYLAYDCRVDDDYFEARVERHPDGSFYGDCGKFDFYAIDEADLRARLVRWGARYAGASHKSVGEG